MKLRWINGSLTPNTGSLLVAEYNSPKQIKNQIDLTVLSNRKTNPYRSIRMSMEIDYYKAICHRLEWIHLFERSLTKNRDDARHKSDDKNSFHMSIRIDHVNEVLIHEYNFHIDSKRMPKENVVDLWNKRILQVNEFDFDRCWYHLMMIPIGIFRLNENHWSIDELLNF